MKNVFKFLSLGVLVASFYAVSAVSIFAQDNLEECQAIYQKFLAQRANEWAAAVATGKEYLQKCSNLPGQEQVKDYVTAQIPKLEDKIAQKKIADMEARFNKALKANNADEIIAAAKDLINLNRPYSLDLMLDIASVGFDKASENPAVDKYNSDSINFAKTALQKMGEGKTSGNADKYGFYAEYKNATCADGKTNAIGWMNYSIGFITYNRLKQTKDALPYLYKASQVGCETKTLPEGYRMIAAWYLDELIKLNNRYKEITKANGDKENDESLALLGMIKGYAERALDAYARAYKIASASKTATAAYKDSLLKRVKEMHGIRYDGDTTKVDAYLSTVSDKPFVDPTTPVTPVVEAVPATGTSASTSTLTSSGGDAPAATTTRTTGSGSATKTTTTTKKAPAKKPIKKKGT